MIVVYGLKNGNAEASRFQDTELGAALKKSTEMRKTHTHVSISSEPGEMVGGFGVDSVENGTLPDGHRYEWSKAHRAGAKIPKG